MQFESGLDDVVFRARGAKLLGGFYRAAGDGVRPTAILLHGVPGVEQNLDIAYALRDAGWNALYFHYRGCFGSEGTYDLQALPEDVLAATEWVLQQPSVDRSRLALAGGSIGGYTALRAGAADTRFQAIVALCPLVDPAEAPLAFEMAESFADMLVGATATELQDQWQSLPPIQSLGDQLSDRDILLISGEADPLFPPSHHQPLAQVLPRLAWRRMPEADHAFSQCRTELVSTVVHWLISRLGS